MMKSVDFETRECSRDRTVTIRRGRLGAGRLCAADYAPGFLGAETFRRQRLNIFFSKNFSKIFSKKIFSKKSFFSRKKFFSQNQVFFQKKFFFPKKHFFLQKFAA